MCRIAGIINKTQDEAKLLHDVKIMCDVMAHGGPDDEGFYINETENFAFGHRRLALIDLSKNGHQPMFYNNDELVITFNGEIYNYLELKQELVEQGFLFNTQTDTEVILASYKAWGIESFNKFNGMFAFALYDKCENTTYLVRDKSAIKPLYYSNVNNSLVFASEVKAFEAVDYEYTENPDWKIYFLAFGHIPEPFTTYSEIKMLPKQHYLKWKHKSNSYILENYSSTNTVKQITNRAEAIVAVRNCLKNSVKNHLLSDAKIGVFLSGGIDSSVLSVLANEVKTDEGKIEDLNTLSINFKEAKFSEKKYQDIIVDKIGGKHSEYLITKEIFDSNFERALNAMDQPTTDGVNSWFVNYFAKKEGLKAVLSGIGADELFGGYPSFNRMAIVDTLCKLPKFLLKKGYHFKNELLKRAYYLSYKNTIGQYLFLRGIFSPRDISALLNCSLNHVDEVLQKIKIHAPVTLNSKEKASWMEMNIYMQNQLLKDTDMMSMQHGIEVRLPFLDQDLIKLMQHCKSNLVFNKSPKKALLIDAFENMIPEIIWNRPKMGFTFPFEIWLKQNKKDIKKDPQNKHEKEILSAYQAGQLHWAKSLAIRLINKKEL
ncbi:asparagine synthase (glutamine-hydrolyzing) [Pedobacter changchengzhani]|uniref:asparagine synthase (glutamine-hydrolyzing) n=1 Tax=Pedobacter changchengzhani TaxID=2529274 RepID=A0A4R5MIC7_9SPHI|nr:asparagine synthase (glutamine-hydrolyzing) [Pedobacter changchengzhani]TDG35312.1 asparagine synthase (glutamine-hydrolyzing) [Pedobacter changchengzhani]